MLAALYELETGRISGTIEGAPQLVALSAANSGLSWIELTGEIIGAVDIGTIDSTHRVVDGSLESIDA